MNVRRPTEADAPVVTELIAAMDTHFVGAPELTEEDLQDEWNDLELDRDAWLFELDGELAGYSVLHTGAHVFADGYVHPRHFGRGVGTRIVELTEEEARSRKLQAIRNAVLAADVHARALLESRGYRALRHFYRMAIELDGPPPPAEWPPGLRAEQVDYEHEAEAFHATLDEAFAEEFGHEPESGIDWRARRERRSFDPTLWFVVKEGDEVAAGPALRRTLRQRLDRIDRGSQTVATPGARVRLAAAWVSTSSTPAVSTESHSASTPRTRLALRVSTSAQACTRRSKQSSTRSRCPCNRAPTPQV
jgi:GNAT superfamily N-acetyltransferase